MDSIMPLISTPWREKASRMLFVVTNSQEAHVVSAKNAPAAMMAVMPIALAPCVKRTPLLHSCFPRNPPVSVSKWPALSYKPRVCCDCDAEKKFEGPEEDGVHGGRGGFGHGEDAPYVVGHLHEDIRKTIIAV